MLYKDKDISSFCFFSRDTPMLAHSNIYFFDKIFASCG
jgi:hypothetical protein